MPDRPYQVKPGDKDFLTLSANLGLSYEALKRANPNVHSLSTGQYLNLPGYNQMNQAGNIQANQSPYNPLTSVGNILGNSWTNVKSYVAQAGNVVKQNLPQPALSTGQMINGNNRNQWNGVSPRPAVPSAFPTPNAQANAWLAAQTAAVQNGTAGPGVATAFRQQEWITNQMTAADAYFQASGGTALPPNLPPEVKAAMLASGRITATEIQQLQLEGAALQTPGANDPLRNTPGHYYVDEVTAPFVNRIIEVNGKRRILRKDNEGKLWYQKPGMSKRGRAAARERTRAKEAAAEAAALVPQDFRQDNMTTVLNVILGS